MRLLVPTVLLALAACTCPAPTTVTPTNTEAAPLPSVVAPTEVAPTLPPSAGKKFGESFSWDDGVTVTISKPRTYKPTEDVMFQDKVSQTFIVMDVVLKNGSKEALPSDQFFLRAKTGSREAMQVMDRGAGVTQPKDIVQPGKEATWKIAFGVDSGQPFVLDAHYQFNRQGITFTE